MVVLTCAQNTVSFVLSDGVEPDYCVTPEVVLGLGMNSILVVQKEFVHRDKWL